MKTPLKKEKSDFSDPQVQEAYIKDAHDAISLLHKELDINHAEQELIKKRLQLMNDFCNDLPSSDPQYSMIRIQIQMDQVELDELKRRENDLLERINLLVRKKNLS
jgi:FtsZ-binding cell division protein ZapB